MLIGGKTFTDRKEAGTALIAACAGLKAVKTEGMIGDYQGFSLNASFDSFNRVYKVTLNPWSLIIISCCNHFVYAVCRYV